MGLRSLVRRPGLMLAVSFAVVIVLVSIMLTTHQENQGWGFLRLAVLIFASLSTVYAIWFGLSPSERDKSHRRSSKTVHRESDSTPQ